MRRRTNHTHTLRRWPYRGLIGLALLALSVLGASTATAQVWVVWSDEFDTPGLPDPAKWSYEVGGNGWGNQEAQYYTEARSENARVQSGVLIIEARKEAFSGSDYTSARLVTRGKGDWRYGRVEVRAQLPAGRGTWPAIWMMPTDQVYGGWPQSGEIDIMEHVGFDPTRVHATVHTEAYNHSIGTQRGSNTAVADAEADYHVYAIEWSPSQIAFFVDDRKYFTFRNEGQGPSKWPFDQRFFLILNIAVGGSWGGQQGIDDGIFPTQMLVDYVRVFENTGIPQVALSAPTEGQVIAPGSSMTLVSDASDPDGAIDRVEFYQDEGLLGVITEPPFEQSIDKAQDGCYSVRAVAYDDQGWVSETEPVAFSVGSACVQAPYLIAASPVPGIVEAEHYDLGGPGVAYSDLTADNTGGDFRAGEEVDVEATQDVGGGFNVGWLARREWIEYTVDVQEAGSYTLDARVASESSGGGYRIEFDGVDKTGEVTFNATGGWQTWDIVRTSGITLEAGVQVMRFVVSSIGFNVNWFRLQKETGTALEDEGQPRSFLLEPNYPNPFNPETTITYDLPEAAYVTLEVYDGYGRRVATLVERQQASGRHDVSFDAAGRPSGIYFYRLRAGAHEQVRTMTLLK